MAEKNMATQLRLPEGLYETIKAIADKELRTMNAQIIYFLKQGVSEYLSSHPPLDLSGSSSNEAQR